MSAYLCSNDTFDYVVTAGARFCERLDDAVYVRPTMPDVAELISEGLIDSQDERLSLKHGEAKIAAILRYQNIRSLKAR